MDPITLILTALAAGGAALAKGTLGEAGKEAYKGLKALIKRRFADKPEAETALVKYEDKPNVWEVPLKDALVETTTGRDEEIIMAAQQVMASVNPQQAAMGKYNVQITGDVQGFVQGDHAEVTMKFDNRPEVRKR